MKLNVTSPLNQLHQSTVDPNLNTLGQKKINNKSFGSYLHRSVGDLEAPNTIQSASLGLQKSSKITPEWVHPDYPYDPESPRKPNMRELMEALSGQSLETLYSQSSSVWEDYARQASEVLYGVVGSKNDTRDWTKIMSSEDILLEAGNETNKLHGASLHLETLNNRSDENTFQLVVLKDQSGSILRTLPSEKNAAKDTLINFGITKSSVSDSILSKNTGQTLEAQILNTLLDYTDLKLDKPTYSEPISGSTKIPEDEIKKL